MIGRLSLTCEQRSDLVSPLLKALTTSNDPRNAALIGLTVDVALQSDADAGRSLMEESKVCSMRAMVRVS
jgi:hypothetical protein